MSVSRKRFARPPHRRLEGDFEVVLSEGKLVFDGFGQQLVPLRCAPGSMPRPLEVRHRLVGVREAHVA